MTALTPGDYIHLGADEAFGMEHDKYVRFVNAARDIAGASGKKTLGRQESARAGVDADSIIQYRIHGLTSLDNLSELGVDLPPDILATIQTTLDLADGDVPATLGAGGRVLMSPLMHVYLDQPMVEPGPQDQEERRQRVGLRLYPGNTVRSSLDWDPLTLRDDVTSEEQVAGVEAAIWCETVMSFADLQFALQPRLAGLAERGWVQRAPVDWDDYSARLAWRAPVWRAASWEFFRAGSVDWR